MKKKKNQPKDGSFGVNENNLASSFLENIKIENIYGKGTVKNATFGNQSVFTDLTNRPDDYCQQSSTQSKNHKRMSVES